MRPRLRCSTVWTCVFTQAGSTTQPAPSMTLPALRTVSRWSRSSVAASPTRRIFPSSISTEWRSRIRRPASRVRMESTSRINNIGDRLLAGISVITRSSLSGMSKRTQRISGTTFPIRTRTRYPPARSSHAMGGMVAHKPMVSWRDRNKPIESELQRTRFDARWEQCPLGTISPIHFSGEAMACRSPSTKPLNVPCCSTSRVICFAKVIITVPRQAPWRASVVGGGSV